MKRKCQHLNVDKTFLYLRKDFNTSNSGQEFVEYNLLNSSMFSTSQMFIQDIHKYITHLNGIEVM